MIERAIRITSSAADSVPLRICSLLVQRRIAVRNVQMSRSPQTERWMIDLVVRLESIDKLSLVLRQLDRLVDVVQIVESSPVSGSDSVTAVGPDRHPAWTQANSA